MNLYSQNGEDKIILNYFGDRIGNLLSLGENDGKSLSNALAMIEHGWSATLVEPAPIAFDKMQQRHVLNNRVECFNFAVSDYNGRATFYDSDSHFSPADTSLLSTLNKRETERWANTQKFEEGSVEVVDFKTLMELCFSSFYQFISIDCEGEDLKILKQINLRELKTEVVCVEWNGKDLSEYDNYISYFGLHLIYKNAENLIYAKQ